MQTNKVSITCHNITRNGYTLILERLLRSRYIIDTELVQLVVTWRKYFILNIRQNGQTLSYQPAGCYFLILEKLLNNTFII